MSGTRAARWGTKLASTKRLRRVGAPYVWFSSALTGVLIILGSLAPFGLYHLGLPVWGAVLLSAPLILIACAGAWFTGSYLPHNVRDQARRVKDASEHDLLTGLSRRSYALRRWARLYDGDRSSRALIVIDLDDFRIVNEVGGTAAGDAVLRDVARGLTALVDGSGSVARGGDQFAIIARCAGRNEALELAQGAREVVESARVRVDGQDVGLQLSASIGIAVCPDDGCDIDSMLPVCERALSDQRQRRHDTQGRAQERYARNVFVAIAEALGLSLEPDERLSNLVRAVGTSFGVDGCSIWMVGSDDRVHIPAYYVADQAIVRRFDEVRHPMTREEMVESGLLGTHPLYLEDVFEAHNIPRRFRRVMEPGSWFMAVPLVAPMEGALTMSARRERCEPPPPDLAVAVANLLSTSLRNSQLYARTQRQAERLTTLAGVGRLLVGEGDFQQRVESVVRRIVETTDYEMVTLDVLDPSGESPYFRCFYGRPGGDREFNPRLEQLWRSLKPVVTDKSIAPFRDRLREPIVMDDPLRQAPPMFRQIVELSQTRMVVLVPIIWDDELNGMLYFSSTRERAYDRHDIALMQTIAAQLAPSLQVATLHAQLRQSYADLKEAHLQAILRLAYAAEARDPYTGRHLRRIKSFSDALGRKLELSDEDLESLGQGAIVHDLGKLRIPDAILIKAGELNDDEWKQMKRHPEYGAELLGTSDFYRVAREVAMNHHERWDGTGYPRGLRGEEIPLVARIVSVADVYDALTSDRPYKVAWAPERALAELVQMRGKQLSPEVVDAFVQLWNEGVIAEIERETAGDHPSFGFELEHREAA